MTYYAGTIGLTTFGIPNDEPRIVCDDCGMVRYVVGRNAVRPAAWFFDGKPPPGWKRRVSACGAKFDLCPECKVKL